MPSSRPNFIFLQGEDAGRYLGCYGDPRIHTPRLDALAASGCRYDMAFSTAPVSAPSRGAMVTGRYAFSVGNHHMRSQLVDAPRTFTEELREAGYYVAWSGKTDFNFTAVEGRHADALLRADEDWVQALRDGKLGQDQPFFCYLNFFITHESTMWGPGTDRRGAHQRRLALEHLIPPELRADPAKMRVPAYFPDTPVVRGEIARFYDALTLLDMQVGEVLDALEASGQKDNTYVIYLTDHGRGLPREKRWLYDAGLHQSLVMAGPGIEPGSVNRDLISWLDIAPTLLSLARVPVPGDYQGQAFLGDSPAPAREYVYAGRDRMDVGYDRCRSVRDKRFLYIRNYYPQLAYAPYLSYHENMATLQVMREAYFQGRLNAEQEAFMQPGKPLEELYDANADPDMVHNLAEDPSQAATFQRLRDALDAHLASTPDLAEFSESELVEKGILIDEREKLLNKTHLIPEACAQIPHLHPTLEKPDHSPWEPLTPQTL